MQIIRANLELCRSGGAGVRNVQAQEGRAQLVKLVKFHKHLPMWCVRGGVSRHSSCRARGVARRTHSLACGDECEQQRAAVSSYLIVLQPTSLVPCNPLFSADEPMLIGKTCVCRGLLIVGPTEITRSSVIIASTHLLRRVGPSLFHVCKKAPTCAKKQALVYQLGISRLHLHTAAALKCTSNA